MRARAAAAAANANADGFRRTGFFGTGGNDAVNGVARKRLYHSRIRAGEYLYLILIMYICSVLCYAWYVYIRLLYGVCSIKDFCTWQFACRLTTRRRWRRVVLR